MIDKIYPQTVTAIIPQKKGRRRVNIYLDGEFWRGLDQEVVVLLSLKEGKVVSSADLEKIVFEEEKKRALDKALRLLKYRARSRKEIEDRLHQAGYAKDVVEVVVADLLRLGYLNDESFIEMWVRDRARNGYGKWRIVAELTKKGIERNLVEDKISQIYGKDKRWEKAFEIGQKKLLALEKEEKSKKYRKLNQYLLRRGFSLSVVTEVCQELLWQDSD